MNGGEGGKGEERNRIGGVIQHSMRERERNSPKGEMFVLIDRRCEHGER